MRSDPITIGPVTLAWPHLFTAQSPRGSKNEPKYNTTCIIDTNVGAPIWQILNDLALQEFPKESQRQTFDWGVRPCANEPDRYPVAAQRGMYYFNAKAGLQYPPQIIDQNRQPMVDPITRAPLCDPGVFQDGAQAWVNLTFYTYNNSGKAGIGVGLGAVMYIGPGEPLNVTGGKVNVEEAFQNVPLAPQQPTGMPAGMPGQPQYPNYPQQAVAPAPTPMGVPQPGYAPGPAPAQPVDPLTQYQQQPQQPVQPQQPQQPVQPQQPQQPQGYPQPGNPHNNTF